MSNQALWYGEYIYADNNGDKVYGNANDAEFQGVSSTPKWNFGLSATAYWKGPEEARFPSPGLSV